MRTFSETVRDCLVGRRKSSQPKRLARQKLLEMIVLEDRLQPAVLIPASDGAMIQAPVIESQNGVLNATFDMVRAGIPGSGESINYGSKPLYSNTLPAVPNSQANYAAAYQVVFPDGSRLPAQFPGVTIKVKHGDTLNLKITNSLGEPNSAPTPDPERVMTNFHAHGYLVSPLGTSDNVYRVMQDGNTYDTTIKVPDNQPSGSDWYHPHKHGHVADQVYAGLAGVFQTGSPLDYFPQYVGKYKEQIFSLTLANKVQTAGGLMMSSPTGTDKFILNPLTKVPVGWQKYVNGQLNPEMTMQPGETQIWTLAGIGRNGAFNLGITDVDGANPWQSTILAFDGNGDDAIPRPYTQVAPTTFTTNTMMVLDPGERITLAVTAPTTPGTYYLVDGLTPRYTTTASPFALMTIHVAGPAASEPAPTFAPTGTVPDLYDPNIKVDNYRSFDFSSDNSGPGGTTAFKINGQIFGQAPIINLQAGQVEEWTFFTKQGNAHPIHLHQNMMAIVAVNGQPVKVDGSGTYPYVSYRDIANIPANGSVTVRFRVSPLPGKYVTHCHILPHEDAGMMMAIVAGPNGSQNRVAAGDLPGRGGNVMINDGFGETLGTVNPFGPKWKGGAATATGNLTGDLNQEIVVGAATPGHTGAVIVYDGQSLQEISRFNAFPEFRHTGVSLAIADLDKDGVGEIIAGRVGPGRSLVRVFEMDGTLVNEIRGTLAGYLPNGVNVAGADFNGDNFDDVAIGAGKGALPRVVGLDGFYLGMPGHSMQVKLFDFLAAPGRAKTGVNLAAGFLAPATQPGYLPNLITAPAQGIDNAKISVWQVNALNNPMANMGGMGMSGEMGVPVSIATILPYGVNRRSVPGGLRLQTTTFGNTGVFALADWNSPRKIMYQAVDLNGNTIKLK